MVQHFLLIIVTGVTIISCFSIVDFLSSFIKIVNAHVDSEKKGKHTIILSKYKSGNIQLVPNPENKQWKELSSEENIQSIFGHNITINLLNNHTHLFFLLSWDDNSNTNTMNINASRQDMVSTEKDNINSDGAVIIFEPHLETEQGEHATMSIIPHNDKHHDHAEINAANNNTVGNNIGHNNPYIWY